MELGVEVEPLPEGVEDVPAGDVSGEDEVPEGVEEVPEGVEEVPEGVEEVPEGVEVVPAGVSAGEVVGVSPGVAPAGVSVLGWQAERAVIKPSIKVTIIFDLTVKILTIIQFSASILYLQQMCVSCHLLQIGLSGVFSTTKVKCGKTFR